MDGLRGTGVAGAVSWRLHSYLDSQRVRDVRDHHALLDLEAVEHVGEATLELVLREPRPGAARALGRNVVAVEQHRAAGDGGVTRDEVVGVVEVVVREPLALLELRERRSHLAGLGEEEVDALGRDAREDLLEIAAQEAARGRLGARRLEAREVTELRDGELHR